MRYRNAFSILFSLLIITSLVITGVPVAAAAGEVSDIDVYAHGDDDRDSDGKYSKFRVGVTADTRVGGFADVSDPFVKIYINDKLLRTTEVNSEANFYREFDFSREELADLDSGTLQIRVEIWDDNLVGNDLEYTSEHTPGIEFEPGEEDRSDKKRALIGIDSIADSYDDAGDYLNVDWLQSEQIKRVEDAFGALLPLSPKEVRDSAAISLLEQRSSPVANAIDTAITAPAVIENVGGSLEAGKQANALQNTDRATRSEFHRHLNELASQEVPTNPDEMSEAELRDRKETLEDAYKSTKEYRASVRKTWDTGALRDNVPGWLASLYGADQDALTKVQAHFTQLEQLLIADYYYTQIALNPDSNIQPQNLTTVTTWREPSYPTAKIVGSDIPDEITVGETATASVTVKTKNSDTPSQTVTIGLPDDDSITNVRISQNDIENPSYSTVYPAGSDLWTGYGDSQEQIPYTVVETAGQMSAGSTHTVEIQFEPTSAGSVRLWLKSVAWTDTDASGGLSPYPRGDPQSQDGVVTDGQDELAEERNINIIDPDPAQFDISAVDMNSPVQAGEDVTVTTTVENTGDLEGTQSVELTVPGVGSDSGQVTLAGGESKTVSFAVSTQSGDSGTHTATIESENDEASSSVSITEQPDAANFGVEIIDTNSPIEASNKLTVTAEVTNTGDLKGTQSVELTVPGVGSDSTSVALNSGESTTISFSIPTETGDADNYVVTVSSNDDTAQRNVEVGSDQDNSFFAVAITDTNTPVEAGTSAEVTAEITNTGNIPATKTVELDVGALGSSSKPVSLAVGTTTTEVFTFSTDGSSTGEYTAIVDSPDDDDTVELLVTDPPDENDRYEPNNDLDAATTLADGSHTDLQIVDGESDYFAVTLNEGDSIEASISFEHGTGDLGMELFSPDRQRMERSTSTSDGESVGADTVTESGTYYVHVYGFGGPTAPYDLDIAVDSDSDSETLTAQEGLATRNGHGYAVDDGDIVKFDLSSDEVVDRFEAPDGRARGLAYGDGSLWFADGVGPDFDGEIVELDPTTGEVRSRISTSYDPRGLAYTDGSLWVADITVNDIVEYSPDGEELSRFDVPTTTPRGLAAFDDSLWLGTMDAALYEFGTNGTMLTETGTRDTTYGGLAANETALFGPDEEGQLTVLRQVEISNGDSPFAGMVPSFADLLDAIGAYNADAELDDQSVTYEAVLGIIRSFNTGTEVPGPVSDGAVPEVQASGSGPVQPGETVEVTYEITNTGPETANAAALALSTPAGVEATSVSGDGTSALEQERIFYTSGLSSGETLASTVTFATAANATGTLSIGGEADLGGETESVTSPIAVTRGSDNETSGDAGIELEADGPASVTPGGETTVTFTMTNTGQTETPSGGLQVSVPGSLSIRTVSGDGTNEPDRFFTEPIPAGESVSATYTFAAPSDASLGAVSVEVTGTLLSGDTERSASTSVEVNITESDGLPTNPGEPGFGDVLEVIQSFNTNSEYANTGVTPGFGDVLEVIQAFNAG